MAGLEGSGGDERTPRPDQRALRAVGAQFFTNGIVYATFIPRLPEIRDRVGISIGALGVVLMLGSISGLVASVFTGRVIGRFGSRSVLIVGSTVSIGSLGIVGWSSGPILLVVGLVGVLFFDVFIDVAMNVQGSELSHRRHTPVINRLHGLWSLGTVTGAGVSVGFARAGIGAPGQLTVVAICLLVALAAVAPGLLRADEHRQPNGPPEPAADRWTVPVAERRHRQGRGRAGSRHRRGNAVALGAGGAAAMLLEVTNGDWATFRLGDDLGVEPGVAGLGFLAFTVGMTVGRLSGDWVQVRAGPTRLIRLAVVVAVAGSAVAALVPNSTVVIVGFLIAGLGVSVLFPQLYDRSARTVGPAGSGFAAMLVGQRSAAIVAPLIVGTLADTAAFGVGAAMAVVALPAAVVMYLTTPSTR